MENKISIIIPVYNVEKFIVKCIESVINQTYKNLEIILIDDGSQDMCPKICDEYSKKDNRVLVVHKKNGGLSDARNKGLDIATGDFVIFVDSDDFIEPDLCEKCIGLFDDDVDIIAYKYRRVYDNHIEKIEVDEGISKYSQPDVEKIYIERKIITHMVSDKMFRRSLFDNVRFIKNRLAEDLAICYKLIGNARSVMLYNKVFYNYYIRNNSIMGSNSYKLCIDAYAGEYESYHYIMENYPQYIVENNTRFLNQSMKTYLKLIKNFGNDNNEDIENEMKSVFINIQEIDKEHMPFKTTLFYCCFRLNKDFAWMLFKKFHLS